MRKANSNKDVSGQPNGWLTLTRKVEQRIMCAVLENDIEEAVAVAPEFLEVRIKVAEIHAKQVRLAILAPRFVTIARAEIDPLLGEWSASDALVTQAELEEEILLSLSRDELRSQVGEGGDPIDLLEIKVERIKEGAVRLRLGTDFRNIRFSRHAERVEIDEFGDDELI